MARSVLWGLCGALIGWVSYLAMRRSGAMRLAVYSCIAVGGAIGGGYLTRRFVNDTNVFALDNPSLLSAILGAIISVLLVGLFDKSTTTEPSADHTDSLDQRE